MSAVAAYSFIPTINPKESTEMPVFSKRNSNGQNVTYRGMNAMHCLDPTVFTLDAPTDYNPNVTYHDEFMRLFKASVAENIRRVLYHQKNRPSALSGWVCPTLEGELLIDLTSEAISIQGVHLPYNANIVPHEAMPFNELTSTGTAKTALQFVKNLKIDVVEVHEKATQEGDDGMTHIIAGDHATVEGTCPVFHYCLMVD